MHVCRISKTRNNFERISNTKYTRRKFLDRVLKHRKLERAQRYTPSSCISLYLPARELAGYFPTLDRFVKRILLRKVRREGKEAVVRV